LPARADLDRSRADGRLAWRGTPDAGSTRSAEVDSTGLEVTETFKVVEAGLDELDHYDVTNAQGGVIDGGIRGSLSDAFLELTVGTEGKDI
jgi:hypothetical protein